MPDTLVPSTFADVAEALAAAAATPRPIRITGASTKLGWGGAVPPQASRLQMVALSRLLSHDRVSMTATLEAGMPLARAQRQLAQSGMTLPLDPPGIELGDRGPTIGGIFATDDAGPLCHRYGSPADLILGAQVALSDGTIAKLNRPLARLFVGSFGTLGVLLSVSAQLHTLPSRCATAMGAGSNAEQLRRAVDALNGSGIRLQALDIAWRRGRGGLLARAAGTEAAASAAEVMTGEGLEDVQVSENDERLWARERAGQRSIDRAVLRVITDPGQLAQLLAIADARDATLVGRAAVGISYLTLNLNQIAPLRAALPPGATAVVLEIPAAARGVIEPWGVDDPVEIARIRSIKEQFDRAGVCNPGIFVGGI